MNNNNKNIIDIDEDDYSYDEVSSDEDEKSSDSDDSDEDEKTSDDGSDDTDDEEEYEDIDVLEPLSPILLHGLQNKGGFSCFMDSILVPIFLEKDGYFTLNILEKELSLQDASVCDLFDNEKEAFAYLKNLQLELFKLSKLIKSDEESELTCKPILQQLRKCNNTSLELMSGRQQDDSEFLLALMDIFNLKSSTIMEKTVFYNNNNNDNNRYVSEITTKIPLLEIVLNNELTSINLLDYFQKKSIEDYINLPKGVSDFKHNGLTFRYKESTNTIIDSNALLFHVNRNSLTVKLKTPVIIQEYIKQIPNKIFQLKIITIHHGSIRGGHYTAYFKHGANWYYYDDMNSSQNITLVHFDTVKEDSSINGSMYMYFPIEINSNRHAYV